jgi:hypothetical protein
MVKLLDLLREVSSDIPEVDYIKNPITTLYHGTSNKYPEINLSNLKIERDEGMDNTWASGFNITSGADQCIGFYLSKSSGINKFPEMERNSAMAFANSARDQYLLKLMGGNKRKFKSSSEKAEMLIYEVKLKPDVVLKNGIYSCVQKHHMDKLLAFDGLQQKKGLETVIWNKDKIQSIKLIKRGVYNPDSTSWRDKIILK